MPDRPLGPLLPLAILYAGSSGGKSPFPVSALSITLNGIRRPVGQHSLLPLMKIGACHHATDIPDPRHPAVH
jgi:hypothetical protein